MAEKITISYDHDIENIETDQNVIGANDDTTGKRIVAPVGAPSANFVRKFGTDYLIKVVTDMTLTGDANMTFRVYAADGTLLGTSTNVAFVGTAGVAEAQSCYLEISCLVAPVVVITPITLDTDSDPGGLGFVCAAETIQIGDTLRLYLSDTTSTYYDSDYMYGGARHTPAVGNIWLPYFHPEAANAALGGARLIVHVLDSATYEVDDYAISRAATIWQAALGQTPKITSGVGARVSREMVNQGDNTDTAYVSKTLALGGVGTYQDPYTTIAAAFAGIGARTNIHIMDSAKYDETINFNAAITIESIYGMLPTIQQTFTITNAAVNIYGIMFDSSFLHGYAITINAITYTGTIADCTISNYTTNGIGATGGGTIFNGIIEYNHIYNSVIGIRIAPTGICNGNIRYNICHTNSNKGINIFVNGAVNISININNNICYDNFYGIEFLTSVAGSTYSGVVENNTVFKNDIGIFAQEPDGTMNPTTRNIIAYHNEFDFFAVSCTPTFTNSCYETNSSWIVGAGNITTDPEFCRTVAPFQLGISANSGAYKTDTSSDDMGAHLRILEINESDIEVNGFIIDGQGQYNNAIFIADAVDHTGLIVRWNTIENFNGIQLDPFDDDANTECIITNNIIKNGGNGLKLSRGGNTVQNNLIYGNTIFSIWSDYTSQSFTHNVLYGNGYGLYLESNSAGITFRDNITSQNTLYGIFSEVALIVTYCDITDATNNVDATDPSNFTDNPLFVNTLLGSEDFHLKSVFGGFSFNSPCINSASDGKDIGAYDVLRTTDEDAWKKYEMAFNPQVRWNNIPKGVTRFNSAKGFLSMWAKAHRRGFVFTFSAPQVSSEELRLKMEYFSTRIRKRESNTVEEETKFRIHFQPTSFLETGTETIDASAGTITDASKSWTENQWKGFHVGVQWTAGIGTGTLAAIAKTLVVAPDPSWTNDEWIGYYYYHNGYYYYILDNDTDTLTLSDPLGTLTNEADIDWNIEKYFKIISSNENVLCLCDADGELPDGEYFYYIDFIQVVINRTDFGYTQPRFLYTKEHSKTNYQISWEETGGGSCD